MGEAESRRWLKGMLRRALTARSAIETDIATYEHAVERYPQLAADYGDFYRELQRFISGYDQTIAECRARLNGDVPLETPLPIPFPHME